MSRRVSEQFWRHASGDETRNHGAGYVSCDGTRTYFDTRDIGTYHDGAGSYYNGPESYYDGPETYYDGSETYNGGRETYYDGPERYYDGPQTYYDGPERYYAGPERYYDGLEPYHDGPETYNGGTGTYYDGPETYYDGSDNYYNGTGSQVASYGNGGHLSHHFTGRQRRPRRRVTRKQALAERDHASPDPVNPLNEHVAGLESLFSDLQMREVSQAEEKRIEKESYNEEREAMEERHIVEKQDMEERHSEERRYFLEKLNNMEEDYSRKNRELVKEKEALKSRIRKLLQEDTQADAPVRAPECPVCFEKMCPPKKIFHCSNGHHVCGACRPRMQQCYCRIAFVGRAVGFEAFLRDVQ